KRLAAYVVAEPMAWSADAVRAQLASTLPDYMVPTALMCLAALPVTSNGKIDRKALPAPTIAAEQAFVAPATACELWLADVWSSLLKPGRPVSAADNFFALGGHSLLAMRVIAKVRQERQAALPITAVFEAQTLAALALRIEQAGPAEAQPIVHRGPGRAPLSHGQQRLWLIDQMGDGASVQYHMPMALELRGELNVALLQQALQLVVQRHEILRTTY
ncbi:phosphopantetheine-binding protein, partial [Janthinobacterium sp. GMG1]|uniref:phosphopantetheine-binding protein n=1 Tax=Janthinobacterium sp. GMG1 TaxID=3096007 RepID=UPI002ACB0088